MVGGDICTQRFPAEPKRTSCRKTFQDLVQLDQTMLPPKIVGSLHYNTAQRIKQTLPRYKEFQGIIAIFDLDVEAFFLVRYRC